MPKRKIPVFETEMNRRLREAVERLEAMSLPEKIQQMVTAKLMTQEEADRAIEYWKQHGGRKNGVGRRASSPR